MNVKILAVVVTYYPNLDELKENILRYLSDVDSVMIWENTPMKDRKDYKIDLSYYLGKALLAGEDDNMYISYPLNKAVEYARLHGFTHVLTMDQDSCFEKGHFAKYKMIATSNENLNIWGPNPNNSFYPIQDIPQSRNKLITSGNIINIKLFDLIGLFREDYKIDCVDHEFCYRAIKNGYSVYSINSVLLHQSFGNKIRTRFNFDTYRYSQTRLYFMARNNIILHHEYPEYGYNDIVIHIFKPAVKIILAESNKFNKIYSLFKGSISGLIYILKSSKHSI